MLDRLSQIPGIKLAEPQVRGFAGFGVFKLGRFYKTRITGQDVCVERGGGCVGYEGVRLLGGRVYMKLAEPQVRNAAAAAAAAVAVVSPDC